MMRSLKIAGFIAALLLLGLFREDLFVSLNALLYYKFNALPPEKDHVSWYVLVLDTFSYRTLYVSKWFITLVFVALFWYIQKNFLSFLFAEKKAGNWLGMLYLSLLLLAGISFGVGWLAGYLGEGYRFSRIFMGLLQSPVPCMLLIPLAYFNKQNRNSI